jgi:hypothetical protein
MFCMKRPLAASILAALSGLGRMVWLIPGPSLRFSPTTREASPQPPTVIYMHLDSATRAGRSLRRRRRLLFVHAFGARGSRQTFLIKKLIRHKYW